MPYRFPTAMPTPIIRSPRVAAQSTLPPEDDEDAMTPQERAVTPSPTGTTGGIIPQQGGEWWVKRAQPVAWSADAQERTRQSMAETDRRWKEHVLEQNPFTFSNAIPATPAQLYAHGAQLANQEYKQQAVAQRTRRREDNAAYNSKTLADYVGRGVQHYVDPASGRVVPVVDPEGRTLFHATDWEETVHPKTGQPVLQKRDRYGQRQFKDMPVVPGLDPTDDKLYFKTPSGELREAGNIADMVVSPNYNVAKTALAANKRRVQAVHQQALAPMKELVDQTNEDLKAAQDRRDELTKQLQQAMALRDENIDNPSLSAGYDATATQLQQQLTDLNAQVGPKGTLAMQAASARRHYDVARRQAVFDVYKAQNDEIAARLRAEGKDPASDPVFQSNAGMMKAVGDSLGQAQAAVAPAATTAQAAPASPLELSEPVNLIKQGTKSIGGVSVQQLAQRFGSGEGPVNPSSLLAIRQRINEIDDTLAAQTTPNGAVRNAIKPNATTQISGKLRKSLTDQRDYLDALYSQRFARLAPEAQADVTKALEQLQPTTATGAAARSAATGVLPAVGAWQGFEAGAALGAPLAAQTRGVAPLVTGAIGAFLGSILADKLQRAALNKVAPDTAKELERLQALDAEGQPVAAAAGALVSNLPVFKANPLMAARGLAALAKIARGAVVNAEEKAAAKILAMQGGFATGVAVGQPLLEGRKPTLGEVTQGVAQMMLFGEARFGGKGGAPGASKPGEKPPLTPEQAKAEAEFQKRLAEPVSPEPAVEPLIVEAPKPEPTRTAEESAQVFEPSLKEGAIPPIKSAAESAEVFAQEIQKRAEEAGLTPEEKAHLDALLKESEPLKASEDESFVPAPEEPISAPKTLSQEPAEPSGATTPMARETTELAPATIAEGRPPVETDPAKIAADRKQYDRLQAVLRRRKDYGSEAYNKLWQQSEDIKNRHGGMPPGEVAAGEKAPELMTPEEAIGFQLDKHEIPRSGNESFLTVKDRSTVSGNAEEWHAGAIEDAIKKGLPVLSFAADAYGIKIPDGYVREGDRYVFKPKPEETQNATQTRQQPENNQLQRPRTPQGSAVSENSGEVRQGEGEQAGGGNRPVGSEEAPQGETPVQQEVAPDLKPPAQMKRPELRAELAAQGIKEVSGVPLEEANAAQLMDAVGKLRRGQLNTEPVRTTDKIIAALQKAKIHKPGALYAATPLSVAHDAALDLAILGIKAGRAVADVIKIAVQRFKAKYPGATEEDVARLTKAIQDAHGTQPEPPKGSPAAQSKSLVDKIGDKFKQIKSESDLKTALAASRDAVEGKSNQLAAETKNEIRDAVARAEPDAKLRQTAEDALGFYIESDNGNKEQLAKMRAVLAAGKGDPKWTARALKAIDYAEANAAKLQDAAGRYHRVTSELLGSEQNAGLPTLEHKNYVPSFNDVETGGWLEPAGKGTATGAANRKNRKFSTMADRIAAGVDPKTLNAVDALTSRVKAGMTGVHLRAWQKAIFDMQDPTTKEPVAVKPERVERADGSYYYQPPKGYNLETLGNTPTAVKKEYAGTVSALTDPSWWGRNKATVLAQKANANAKALTLAVDTFHLGRLAFRSAMINASHPKEFTVGPTYRKGLLLADHSPAEITRMAESGEIPKENLPRYLEDKAILDKGVRAGYNIGHVADAMHQEMIQSLPILGKVNKFIFQQFQRGAMTDAYTLEYRRQKADYPNITDDQVAAKVSRELMTRFGNLGRQGLFKSKGWQDTARMLFLAPQWNEGLIRSELGGAKQIAEAIKNTATGQKAAMGLLGREMLTTGISLFAASQIINMATRGHPTWENPEEGWGAKVSAWIPDKLGGSSGFFLNPMGLTAEIGHQLLNNFEQTKDARLTLLRFIRSRASATTRPLWTLATGEDYLGRKLKPADVTSTALEDAIPAPISGGSAVRVAKGLATGGKTEKFPGEFQKQAMQSFGLKTDKAPSPEGRIANLAREFNEEHGKEAMPPGTVSDFQELTEAVRRGNDDDVKAAIATLLEKRSAEDLEKYYRQWQNRMFTGSHKNEAAFIRSLNPEQRQQYAKARAERRRLGELALRAIRAIPPGKRAGLFAPAP